jgi:hypothetical protein
MENPNYLHGKTTCRDCFTGSEQIMHFGDWRLHNNPGYYGSSSPEILILGFSKGANQNKVAETGDFDRVAFANARQRLQEILENLSLMPKDRHIDALMTANEKTFGVASLVRCSFGKMVDGKCLTSGTVIPSSFTNTSTLKVIEHCADKFLGTLPQCVRVVVLLGTSDTYIKKTTALIKRLHSNSFKPINDVSFLANGALWIYATHPSPGNGHFTSWTNNDYNDRAGKKRILAQEALAKHYLLNKLPNS